MLVEYLAGTPTEFGSAGTPCGVFYAVGFHHPVVARARRAGYCEQQPVDSTLHHGLFVVATEEFYVSQCAATCVGCFMFDTKLPSEYTRSMFLSG